MSPDPEGQASLMLCEGILHLLVEERVITKGRALEAINGVLELLRESEQIGQRRSTTCSAVSRLEAIARTFALRSHAPSPLKEQTKVSCEIRDLPKRVSDPYRKPTRNLHRRASEIQVDVSLDRLY
jgi:hypothetical protein